MPNLDGWLIAESPPDGGGLQLQPDGNLLVYALCDLDPTWIAAAQHYRRVLVLHGPRIGLRVSPGQENADTDHLRSTELATARKEGLVTGGLLQWGRA